LALIKSNDKLSLLRGANKFTFMFLRFLGLKFAKATQLCKSINLVTYIASGTQRHTNIVELRAYN
jgi:hypothetical protein